jgi:hypothetical protein
MVQKHENYTANKQIYANDKRKIICEFVVTIYRLKERGAYESLF